MCLPYPRQALGSKPAVFHEIPKTFILIPLSKLFECVLWVKKITESCRGVAKIKETNIQFVHISLIRKSKYGSCCIAKH